MDSFDFTIELRCSFASAADDFRRKEFYSVGVHSVQGVL